MLSGAHLNIMSQRKRNSAEDRIASFGFIVDNNRDLIDRGVPDLIIFRIRARQYSCQNKPCAGRAIVKE